ncbi:metallophosphoesterase family protein [Thermomonospora amylolytica]|uniref:metallophosphoesterase family protein n=1 Tax=Thermomonospora amylolytica TaxID=1411117 RepID=UPI000E6D27E2|nr:metallophosphoesterase family protein [Thermomonospora amylolytica]
MRADDDARPPAEPETSRTSEAGAGWGCGRPGRFLDLLPAAGEVHRFSWRHPGVLWRSRNDWVAKAFGDPSGDIRRAWVRELRRRDPDPSFTMRREEAEFSFLLLGDTGEGDRSQYAVVPPMLAAGGDTDFMVICSDVIYPGGEAADYEAKFFRPYAGYPGPIYAIPGNHDWYDGLRGFMHVFCDLPGEHEPPPWRGATGRLARLLWRRPAPVDEAALKAARERFRGAPGQQAVQPGPYWAIDSPSLRIVGIDTGITGGLDRDQAAWLREVSAGDKPKLLVTGKPLLVDGRVKPGRLEGETTTILDIVEDPAHHYVAAIGGDIHNYQRYSRRLGDGRTIEYVVSGGGGAFMHATHVIPRTTLVEEGDFRCYPLRGDSLSRYSRLYARWLRMRWLELSPQQATAVVAHRLGMDATRAGDRGVAPSRRARIVAALLGVPCGTRERHRMRRLPVRKVPQHFRSEFADWDRPPFFKNFLRVDVTPDALTIRCFGVTGCGEHEDRPPVEDSVTVPLR